MTLIEEEGIADTDLFRTLAKLLENGGYTPLVVTLAKDVLDLNPRGRILLIEGRITLNTSTLLQNF